MNNGPDKPTKKIERPGKNGFPEEQKAEEKVEEKAEKLDKDDSEKEESEDHQSLWGSSGQQTALDNNGDYNKPQKGEIEWFKEVNFEFGISFDLSKLDEEIKEKAEEEEEVKLDDAEIKQIKEGVDPTRLAFMCERDGGEPFGYTDKTLIMEMYDFFDALQDSGIKRSTWAFIEQEFKQTPIVEKKNVSGNYKMPMSRLSDVADKT